MSDRRVDGRPLAVSGITKRFGARRALVAFTLDLAPGEIVALIGANGAGKTTALRILAGLMKPDGGTGQVLGHALPRRSTEIRRQVGYMAQRFALHPNLDAIETLRFRAEIHGLRQPARAARDLVERYGLAPVATTPAGLLSGGWARRLQLAAALVHEPRLVLLDEPTAGLDVAARQEVWRRIGDLAASGVGVIVSTHDLLDAERCHRMALMVAGRTIAMGSASAVTADAGAAVRVLSGPGALGEAARIEVFPGVRAVFAQGGALRVVGDAAAMELVEVTARHLGLRSDAEPPRLEDAALMLIAGAPVAPADRSVAVPA